MFLVLPYIAALGVPHAPGVVVTPPVVAVGGNAPYWQSYIPFASRSRVRVSLAYRAGPKRKRKADPVVVTPASPPVVEVPGLPVFVPTVSPAPRLALVRDPSPDVVEEVVSRLRWRVGPTSTVTRPKVVAPVIPAPAPDWRDDEDLLRTLHFLLAA